MIGLEQTFFLSLLLISVLFLWEDTHDQGNFYKRKYLIGALLTVSEPIVIVVGSIEAGYVLIFKQRHTHTHMLGLAWALPSPTRLNLLTFLLIFLK